MTALYVAIIEVMVAFASVHRVSNVAIVEFANSSPR